MKYKKNAVEWAILTAVGFMIVLIAVAILTVAAVGFHLIFGS